MACPSLAGRSLLWTQHLCRLCIVTVHHRAADVDGGVFAAGRRLKERTHPELSGPRSQPVWWFLPERLEDGGLRRSEPPILKKRAEQAWRLIWGAILACAAARAVAASLLQLRYGSGTDGDVPSTHEVVNDLRHAGLAQHASGVCVCVCSSLWSQVRCTVTCDC